MTCTDSTVPCAENNSASCSSVTGYEPAMHSALRYLDIRLVPARSHQSGDVADMRRIKLKRIDATVERYALQTNARQRLKVVVGIANDSNRPVVGCAAYN